MVKTFCTLILSLVVLGAVAEQQEVKILEVVNGSTLRVIDNENYEMEIILEAAVAPALDQQYGDAAKKFMETKLLDKKVKISITGKDRRGNRIAVVFISGKKKASDLLINKGLAWARLGNELALEHQKIAMSKKAGLWQEADPTPPWIYARQNTMRRAKLGS